MDKQEQLRIIEEMQQVAQQMRQDDIDDNPDCLEEYFTCAACGKTKDYAGSIKYSEHRLCNDCVLLAETGFALGRLKNVQDLIDAMEEDRLEGMCEFIKTDEKSVNN